MSTIVRRRSGVFALSGLVIMLCAASPVVASDVSELEVLLDRALSELVAIESAQADVATKVANIEDSLRGGASNLGASTFDTLSGTRLSDAYRTLTALAAEVDRLRQRIDDNAQDLEKGFLLAQTMRDAGLTAAYADALKRVETQRMLNKQLKQSISDLQRFIRSFAEKSRDRFRRHY